MCTAKLADNKCQEVGGHLDALRVQVHHVLVVNTNHVRLGREEVKKQTEISHSNFYFDGTDTSYSSQYPLFFDALPFGNKTLFFVGCKQ